MMNFRLGGGFPFRGMHGGDRRGSRGTGYGRGGGDGLGDERPDVFGRGGCGTERAGSGCGPAEAVGGGRRGGGSGPGFGGGRRGGGFAGGFGGRMGGDGMMRGRKLSAAELQLVLLALLDAKPAHGYELIRQLEERSGGFYTPSPGVIYPALTYLDDVGEAIASAEGQRKLYTITEAGRQRLASHRDQVEAILDVLARIGRRMGEVREAFAGDEAIGPDDGGDLRAIRHALRRALIRKRGCSAAEARRVADVLRRAIEEIDVPGE